CVLTVYRTSQRLEENLVVAQCGDDFRRGEVRGFTSSRLTDGRGYRSTPVDGLKRGSIRSSDGAEDVIRPLNKVCTVRAETNLRDRSDVRRWDQVVGVLPRVEVVLDREGRCSPTQCYGCGNRRSQREGSRCAIQSRHWNVVAVHLNDDLGHVGRNYAAVGAIDDGGVGNLEYCVAV